MSAVVVIGLIAIGVALASGSDDSDTDARSSRDPASTPNRDEGSAVATLPETRPAPDDLEVSSGFSQLAPNSIGASYVSYAVILTNPSTDQVASNVSLTIAMYDAAGTVVSAQDEYVSAVLPNQKAAVASYTDAAEVTRIEVQSRVQSWEEFSGTPGTFTVTDPSITPQEYSGPRVTGTIASSFSQDFTDVLVVAVFYNAENQIVGGAFTFADLVPAGGTTAFEVSSLVDVPFDHVEIIPSLSSLSLI